MIYDTHNSAIPSSPSGFGPVSLSVKPPFLWPDTRYLAKHGIYPETPPMANVIRDADLISGVLVDATEGTLSWLDNLLCKNPARRIRLVVVISPACPTRDAHLRALLKLSEFHRAENGGPLEVRILAMSAYYGENCHHSVLPPTTIQAHSSKSGETWTCIGSVGDSGHGPVFTGSLNLVFRTDPVLRNSWRKWFQYLLNSASPLNEDTCHIPYLVPPQGTQEAALAWAEFVATCAQTGGEESAPPTVDPETGEVLTDAEGNPPDSWDGGETALDPLANKFQEIYAAGSLVSVNEQTRIKPLDIPVKATLLGQSSVKTVGALTQRQSFTLRIFDDHVCKEIEKCRKITDLVELLSFPLSQGNRWLPNAAKPLLELELEARNRRGFETLLAALGGKKNTTLPASPDSEEAVKARNDQLSSLIREFIARQKQTILADLDQMYRDLKRGDAVPEDKAKEVLDEVEKRITAALAARITPTCAYNALAAPDLSPAAPDDNWLQPLSLLGTSAMRFREQLTDYYFDRKFSGMAFTKQEFLLKCNVFEDQIASETDSIRAKAEIVLIKEFMDSEMKPKDKCMAVWKIVSFSNSSNAIKL
jgi:hypothetical protein